MSLDKGISDATDAHRYSMREILGVCKQRIRVISKGMDAFLIFLGECAKSSSRVGLVALFSMLSIYLLVGSFFTVFGPLFLKNLINLVFRGRISDAYWMAVVYGSVMILSGVANAAAVVESSKISRAVGCAATKRVTSHILRRQKDMSQWKNDAEVIRMMGDGLGAIRSVVTSLATIIVPTLGRMIILIGLLIIVHDEFALLFLGFIGLMYTSAWGLIGRRSSSRLRVARRSELGMSTTIDELVRNSQLFKVNNSKGFIQNEIDAQYKNVDRAWNAYWRDVFWFRSSASLIFGISLSGLLAVVIHKIELSKLSIGELVVVNLYAMQVILPLGRLGAAFRGLTAPIDAISLLVRFLHEPVEEDIGTIRLQSQVPHAIEFRNVTLHDEKGRTILDDISFKIGENEKVLITGVTGAGKSTILKLILRLVEPSSGEIYVGGYNIKDVTLESLRNSISYVEQGRRYSSLSSKVLSYLGTAELSSPDFYRISPNGSNALGDGKLSVNNATKIDLLSGGEEQRVAVIRALRRRSGILLADEPTGSQDAASAEATMRAILASDEPRTTLVVSHTLPYVAAADHVMLVKDGQLIDKGTGKEILYRWKEVWSH